MFFNPTSHLRGSLAGADAVRGEKLDEFRRVIRRCRYHSDKPSLAGHHRPLTLSERVKLQRWAMRG